MCLLTRDEAEQFYACHRQQPFFVQLIDFITSGRIVAMELLLEGSSIPQPSSSACARHCAHRACDQTLCNMTGGHAHVSL